MLTQSIKYLTFSREDLINFQDYIIKSISNDVNLSWNEFVDTLTHEEVLKRSTDQSTMFHKAIYSGFDEPSFSSSSFYRSYFSLIITIYNDFISCLIPRGDCAVQRYPTFRIHYPDNVSVFEFHRDSDYSHPLSEINCFIALTDCIDSSALQIEKHLGHDDYFPLNLKEGTAAILNTSIFRHGDMNNLTSKSRISFDFRFVPISALNDPKKSLSSNRLFTVDSYFMKLPNSTCE